MHKSVVPFLRKKNFTRIKPLGEGAYGIVLSAESRDKEAVAVKVIDDNYSWKIEEEVWPSLNHSNILPLLEVFVMPKVELKLYISPLHPDSLDRAVEKKAFRADPEGLHRIRKWFREILCGLDYLHLAGYVHMDIKSDNVLLTISDSAVLCDFSGLNYKRKKIRRMCAPKEYCPPEYWRSPKSKGLDGVPFDIWSFGLMALGVLTSHWPQKNLWAKRKWTWDDDLWPRLVKVIQEPTFSSLVKDSLPNVVLPKEELKKAKHFILSLMRISPEQRPTAKTAGRHHFLLRISNSRKKSDDAAVSVSNLSTCSIQLDSGDDEMPSLVHQPTWKQRRRVEKRPFSSESLMSIEGVKGISKKGNPKRKRRKRSDSGESVVTLYED